MRNDELIMCQTVHSVAGSSGVAYHLGVSSAGVVELVAGGGESVVEV